MATNQGFANLVCHEKVHNWFLFYRLRLIKKELEGLASGSTFREISKRSIREIKIPLPSIKEQIKITEIMTIFDEEQEKQSSQKGILEKTKNGLMQELLSGKLRVI
jgi:type I restriction enzyme S subunit